MPINLERTKDYEVVLTQDIEGEDWKQAQKAAFNQLKQGLNLKGFRKGRVPDHFARQVIPAEAVYDRAVEPLAQKMLEEGIKEFDLEIVDRPTLDYENPSKDQVTLILKLIVRPVFELPDYQNLEVERPDDKLSDEEFDVYFKSRLEPYANWVVVDEAEAGNGDVLVLDAKALDENGPLAGSEFTDTEIVMGARPEYEAVYQALEGMKADDVRTVTVVVPEYEAEIPFEFTLNEIRRKEYPEVTDEFVTEKKLADSAEAYRQNLYGLALQAKKNEADNAYVDQKLDKILEQVEINFPEAMVESKINQLLNQYLNYLAQSGMPVEMLVESIQANPDAMREQFETQAMDALKLEAVLLAIAEKEGFKPEEDLDRSVANFQLMQQAIDYLKQQ